MADRKRVAYARINRRSDDQEALEVRPFDEDMRRLAESHQTVAELRGFIWVAADLRIVPTADFMTGILGFADQETLHDLEPEAFTWLKGPTHTVEGASRQRTLVPFAVDLREEERWVAFGTTNRIQPSTFALAFEATLNAAVANLGLAPTEWAVDVLGSKEAVEQWLIQNPDVVRITRTVRLKNPGRRLDEDRRDMRALNADTKRVMYSTRRRHAHLRVQDNDAFEEQLEGVDTGDADLIIEARRGGQTITYSSRARADRRYVEDYGDDLEYGMEVMLRAVQEYAVERAGGQERMA